MSKISVPKMPVPSQDFYDFEWSGVLETANCWRPQMAIDQQLLYTVGQLNGNNSVGRLDQVTITNVQSEETEYGCRITYEARMPVAWADANGTPEAYEFILPRNMSWDGVDNFVEKYTETCLKAGATDVDSGVFGTITDLNSPLSARRIRCRSFGCTG